MQIACRFGNHPTPKLPTKTSNAFEPLCFPGKKTQDVSEKKINQSHPSLEYKYPPKLAEAPERKEEVGRCIPSAFEMMVNILTALFGPGFVYSGPPNHFLYIKGWFTIKAWTILCAAKLCQLQALHLVWRLQLRYDSNDDAPLGVAPQRLATWCPPVYGWTKWSAGLISWGWKRRWPWQIQLDESDATYFVLCTKRLRRNTIRFFWVIRNPGFFKVVDALGLRHVNHLGWDEFIYP